MTDVGRYAAGLTAHAFRRDQSCRMVSGTRSLADGQFQIRQCGHAVLILVRQINGVGRFILENIHPLTEASPAFLDGGDIGPSAEQNQANFHSTGRFFQGLTGAQVIHFKTDIFPACRFRTDAHRQSVLIGIMGSAEEFRHIISFVKVC